MTSISDTEVVNAPGGLVELGYQVTNRTNVTISATSQATATELVSTTVICDGSPILIELDMGVAVNTGEYIAVGVWVDGTFNVGFAGSLNAAGRQSFSPTARIIPASGARTISIRWYRWSGTTLNTYIEGNVILRVSKILQASQLLVTQSNAPTVTDLPSNPVINQEVHHLVNNSYFDKKYNGTTWVNINEQPSVEIVAGAGQTGFVVDTWTKLTFPSAAVTNNFGFTISNGVITIPSNLGGLYHVSGQCQWDANSSGIRLLTFAESGNYNGTVLSGSTASLASYMRTSVSGLIRLTAGQSYCLWGINSGSGGTRDLIITFLTQRFNIVRVSS